MSKKKLDDPFGKSKRPPKDLGSLTMEVAITGANGFVGSRLAALFAQEAWSVRPVVRSNPRAGQWVCGPLEGPIDWAPILAGADVVVHTAARVHQMRDDIRTAEAKFDRVNHVATIELARQAASVGVQRFVFLSSIKVCGESTMNRSAFRSNDIPAPQDAYARSKLSAEQGLKAIAAETGMEVVVVRPPLVYGTGVKGNFLQLLKLVNRGIPLPIGCIKNKRSMVSVSNLCDLLAVCCTHPAAANQTFLVSDDHDLSTPDLVRELARAMGRSARLLPLPTSALSWLGKLTGKTEQISRLTDSLEVDISATKATLNWVPPLSMEDGIRETVTAFLKG